MVDISTRVHFSKGGKDGKNRKKAEDALAFFSDLKDIYS